MKKTTTTKPVVGELFRFNIQVYIFDLNRVRILPEKNLGHYEFSDFKCENIY